MFTVINALPVSTPVNREAYVQIGQSNEQGRALGTPPEMFPRDRVKMLRGLGFVEAAEPIHEGSLPGPGLSFGTTLARLRPNVEIGLVPAAYGGSSLADWSRNLDPSSLYGAMIAKALVAKGWGKLTGIVCDQGESDAMTSYAIANAWDVNFLQLVSDIRADLGMPNLPVVFAIKRNNPGLAAFPYWDAMLTAQRRVSGANIDSFETSDLTYRTDHPDQAVHLDMAGAVAAGERGAAKMQGLLTA